MECPSRPPFAVSVSKPYRVLPEAHLEVERQVKAARARWVEPDSALESEPRQSGPARACPARASRREVWGEATQRAGLALAETGPAPWERRELPEEHSPPAQRARLPEGSQPEGQKSVE